MTWRLGTRGSALAVAQSGLVAQAVTAVTGEDVELVTITTHGDTYTGPLTQSGNTGVFVTAVREALRDGTVDFVVHSFKDLPTAPVAGIQLAAVPKRETPWDVLCVGGAGGTSAGADSVLAQLPPGARVGTGSPRRVGQLRAKRPDLVCVPVRGNIDTRLGAIAKGDVDAVILAGAGLNRLGLKPERREDLTWMLPAPAQGALAVECRSADAPHIRPWDDTVRTALRHLDHPDSRVSAAAERAVLATLEAGCTAPLGTYAHFAGGAFTLEAGVFATDGSSQVRDQRVCDGLVSDFTVGEAVRLGRELAEALLAHGARDLL